MRGVRSYSSQHRVKRFLGIPVIMQRSAVPDASPGEFKWGRWKFASFMDCVALDAHLRGADQ